MAVSGVLESRAGVCLWAVAHRHGLGFYARLTYIFGHVAYEGLPTLNAGKPWSEDDLADLKDMVRQCRSPGEIAEYLQREALEVEAKIAERFG